MCFKIYILFMFSHSIPMQLCYCSHQVALFVLLDVFLLHCLEIKMKN